MNTLFYLYQDGAWSLHATLSTGRRQGAGVVIKGSPDKLWITGGYPSLKATEFVFADGTVETGPNLPEANKGECSVQGAHHFLSIIELLDDSNDSTLFQIISFSSSNPRCHPRNHFSGFRL